MTRPEPKLFKPSARQCALLLLYLVRAKEEQTRTAVKRTRISALTLTNLWVRSHISMQFLGEVQEWLLTAGWALFFADSTYALVRVGVVEAWASLASKRLAADIETVRRGGFHFTAIESLFFRWTDQTDGSDDDDIDAAGDE